MKNAILSCEIRWHFHQTNKHWIFCQESCDRSKAVLQFLMHWFLMDFALNKNGFWPEDSMINFKLRPIVILTQFTANMGWTFFCYVFNCPSLWIVHKNQLLAWMSSKWSCYNKKMLKFGHCPLVSTYLLLNTSEVTFLLQYIQWRFRGG